LQVRVVDGTELLCDWYSNKQHSNGAKRAKTAADIFRLQQRQANDYDASVDVTGNTLVCHFPKLKAASKETMNGFPEQGKLPKTVLNQLKDHVLALKDAEANVRLTGCTTCGMEKADELVECNSCEATQHFSCAVPPVVDPSNWCCTACLQYSA
jgi:hypothetical protein